MAMPDEHYRPYLTMAVFCEKVLQERDGVLSLIRIIDQFNISGPAEEMPPTQITVNAVICFKAGFVRGKYVIKLRPVSPAGKEMAGGMTNACFEGDDRGVNLIMILNLLLKGGGNLLVRCALRGGTGYANSSTDTIPTCCAGTA